MKDMDPSFVTLSGGAVATNSMEKKGLSMTSVEEVVVGQRQ